MKPAYAEAASLLKDQSVSMITIHSDRYFFMSMIMILSITFTQLWDKLH